MQSSEVVLHNLSKQAVKQDHTFHKIYRHLYNVDFYQATLTVKQMDNLIAMLRDESYQPLCDEVLDDALNEALTQLLQAIYQPAASKVSHTGATSRQTKFRYIKQNFTQATWLLSGAIRPLDDALHHTLIDWLTLRIKDQKMIRLLWKLRKSYESKKGSFQSLLQQLNFYSFDARVKLNAEITAYVRHEGDYLLAVTGHKKNAQAVHQCLVKEGASICIIKHSKQGVPFLQHHIRVRKRATCDTPRVQLLIPKGTIEKIIVQQRIVKDINAKSWVPLHRTTLVTAPADVIVKTYNEQLRKWYRVYQYADNVTPKMQQLHYMMEYSCLKTLANKYKTTVSKIKTMYREGKTWGVPNGTGTARVYFYNEGYARKSVFNNG